MNTLLHIWFPLQILKALCQNDQLSIVNYFDDMCIVSKILTLRYFANIVILLNWKKRLTLYEYSNKTLNILRCEDQENSKKTENKINSKSHLVRRNNGFVMK